MVFIPQFVPDVFLSMYLPAIYAGLIIGFIGTMAIAMKREEIHILILTDIVGLAMLVVVSAVSRERGMALRGRIPVAKSCRGGGNCGCVLSWTALFSGGGRAAGVRRGAVSAGGGGRQNAGAAPGGDGAERRGGVSRAARLR